MLSQILFGFFFCALLGWSIEVAYSARSQGRFINAGLLNGRMRDASGDLGAPLPSGGFLLAGVREEIADQFDETRMEIREQLGIPKLLRRRDPLRCLVSVAWSEPFPI